MELQKELLKKHLKNRGLTKYSMRAEHYGACLDAISEALNIPNVVGRSEQLPETEKLCRMNQNFVCNCIDDSRCPNF